MTRSQQSTQQPCSPAALVLNLYLNMKSAFSTLAFASLVAARQVGHRVLPASTPPDLFALHSSQSKTLALSRSGMFTFSHPSRSRPHSRVQARRFHRSQRWDRRSRRGSRLGGYAFSVPHQPSAAPNSPVNSPSTEREDVQCAGQLALGAHLGTPRLQFRPEPRSQLLPDWR